ncbi:hypothetical protein IAT38_007348 [Cryptococcus sp. DSM 104549]
MALSSSVTSLKWLSALLSIAILGVSAAMLSQVNSRYIGLPTGIMHDETGWQDLYGFYNKSGPVKALVAAGVVGLVYLFGAGVMTVTKPDSIVVSVIYDMICLSALFVLFTVPTALLSRYAGMFKTHANVSWCKMGTALIGLGWVMVGLLVITALIELVAMYTHHRLDYPAWSSSFNKLFKGNSNGRKVNKMDSGTGAGEMLQAGRYSGGTV